MNTVEQNHDHSFCYKSQLSDERQIQNANKLGNALLAGLISDSIIENKKNIKIASSLGSLSEVVKSYTDEISKLKSMQIAACSDILDVKESTDYENQNSIAENLRKIEEVLKSHVLTNAAKVMSRKELKTLNDQMKLIDLLKDELSKQPSNGCLKEHAKMIEDISGSLLKISLSIQSVKTAVDLIQSQAVLDSASTL